MDNEGIYSMGERYKSHTYNHPGREFRGSLITWPESQSDSQNTA